MKMTELKNILREVIRSECKSVFKEVLTEMYGSPAAVLKETPCVTESKKHTLSNKNTHNTSSKPKIFNENGSPLLSFLNDMATDPETQKRIQVLHGGVVINEGVDTSTLEKIGIKLEKTEHSRDVKAPFENNNMSEIPAPTRAAEILRASLAKKRK